MEKKRRKSRRTLTRAVAVLIVITVFAVALIFFALSQNKPAPPKKNSIDYFAISGPPSGPAATGRYAAGSNETVLIDRFGFYFMPIGGDAHEITLFIEGKITSEDFFWLEIKNGTETFSGEIMPQFEILSHKQADGYPVRIRIFSEEADGYLNITIPVEDVNIIG